MAFTTLLTKAVGIRHPVIQGGMHYVGNADLASAVSNAGGLGMVTALSQPSAEALQKEIQRCKSMTKNPFGVNLTLLPTLVPPNYAAYADVVVKENIPLVETAGHYKGLEPFIKLFKSKGILVLHKCTQIKHAQTAARLGADMISVDGFECAGHPGEADVGNWVLLAQAQKELKVPFLASGGCATGDHLVAALALGAQGISMGTRFMATVEAPIHQNIKNAIVNADINSTTLVMRSVRNTERAYKNKAAEEVQRIEKEFPGDFSKFKHLVSGAVYKRVFQETGNLDEGVWSAGLCMALIDDIPTCKELVDRIVGDAEKIIQQRLLNAMTKHKSL